MTPTVNNDGRPYIIAMDVAKEGAQVWDLTTYLKARVNDSGFPLQIKWTNQGQLMNLEGFRPYVQGNVGQYKIDDDDHIIMDADAAAVSFTGDPKDCLYNGVAVYRFPEQMFPKEGIFKGFVGLRDEAHNRMTGIDVYFVVLADTLQMGTACDFYISDLEKAIQNAENQLHENAVAFQKQVDDSNNKFNQTLSDAQTHFTTVTNQALEDLKTKYAQKAEMAEESLDATNTTIKDTLNAQKALATTLASIQSKLEAEDVITISEYNKDQQEIKDSIGKQLSQIKSNIEAFANIDALKAKYPNGKEGIFVVMNTGHGFIWNNNEWLDCGPFGAVSGVSNGLYNSYEESLPNNSVSDDTNWQKGRDAWYVFGRKFGPGFLDSIYIYSESEQPVDCGCAIIDANSNQVIGFKYIKGNNLVKFTFNQQINNQFFVAFRAYEFRFITSEKNGISYCDFDASSNFNTGRTIQINWKNDVDYTPYLKLEYYPVSKIIENIEKALPAFDDKRTSWDLNEYTEAKNYFLDFPQSDSQELKNAPEGARWGSYSLINHQITGTYFVQTAVTYHSETGNGIYIRYIGVNSNGKPDTSSPQLTEWFKLSNYTTKSSQPKLFAAGDSITAGHPFEKNTRIAWANQIGRQFGYQVTRGAQNGSGYIYQPEYGAVHITDTTDFSQYQVAIYAFGTNDYGNNMELGKIGDSYPGQKTFYGAIDYVINKIYKSNPSIVLILSTPIMRCDHGNPDTQYAYNSKNDVGYTLNDYVDAEIALAKKYGIPYIDNRQSPFNVLSVPTLLVDKLHPTEAGYRILGPYLSAKIGSIIRPYIE